jgi:hypothetical protein
VPGRLDLFRFSWCCTQAPPASCSLRAGPFFADCNKVTDVGVSVAMTGVQKVAGPTSSASATRPRLRTAAALPAAMGNGLYGKPAGGRVEAILDLAESLDGTLNIPIDIGLRWLTVRS